MDVVTLESADNTAREIVIRQYGPWHKDDNSHPAAIEATVLRHLAEHAVAVPGLILAGEATEIMGTPTIVTSYVDGKPVVRPHDVRDWAEQLVEAIVPVHNLPPTPGLRATVPSLFTAMERLFSRPEPTEQIAGHPLGPRLWKKCKERWPSIDKSAENLIHADYWPGNTLWKDDRLVSIVDWEEPRLGEPSWDIAVIVQDSAIFGMDIEEVVLEHHHKIAERSLRDFGFWRMYVAMTEMPDPGVWVEGYRSLGGDGITADEVRANHTATIERMLDKT
jgi:aminoglycoside phosphotransferase (APT) family kinase protein